MKNHRHLSVRLLAFLLVTVMLVTAASVGVSALVGDAAPAGSDGKNAFVELTYDETTKTFSLLFDAERFDVLAEKGASVSTEDIRALLPEGLVAAVEARDMGAILSALGIDTAELLDAALLESVMGEEMIALMFEKYVTLPLLLEVMSHEELLSAVDTEKAFADLDYEAVKGLLTDDMAKKLVDDETVGKLLADPAVRNALLTDAVIRALATPALVEQLCADLDPATVLTQQSLVDLVGEANAALILADGKADFSEVFTYTTVADFFAKVMSPLAMIEKIGEDKAIATLRATYTNEQLIDKLGVPLIVETIGAQKLLSYVDITAVLAEIPDKQLIELVDMGAVIENTALSVLFSHISAGELVSKIVPALQGFLIEQVSLITLNGTDIYSDGKIHFATMVEAILSGTASLADFAASDSAYLAEYALVAKTAKEDISLNLKIGFRGDTAGVKTLLAKISTRFDVAYENGVLSLYADAGSSISAMYANLLASETADEALKQKVITLFVASGDELRELFEGTTAEELLEVLSYAPQGSVLHRIYTYLDGKADAAARINAIKDRVIGSSFYREHSLSFYNLYERIMRESLAAWSTEAGVFEADETYTFDMVSFLANSFESLRDIAAICDDRTLTVTVDLHLELAGLNQLHIVDEDGQEKLAYVLPTGADLSYVLQRPEVKALGISTWTFDGSEEATAMPADNAILSPLGTYTVTFYEENGAVAEIFVLPNSEVFDKENAPALPQKEHYTAVWGYEQDGRNIKVRPLYTPIDYQITFAILQNGEYVFYATRTYNIETEAIEEPIPPARVGYTATWEYDLSLLTDIEATIQYTPIVYTATFTDLLGNTLATRTFTVEDDVIPVPDELPSLSGYTFAWPTVSVPADPTDVTIKVVCTPIVYYVICTVDGKEYARVPYTVADTAVVLPAVPERMGYVGTWSSYELGTANVSVNAVYTARACDYGGEESGIFGDAPAIPEKKGYTAEWSYTLNADGTMTARPIYTPIVYEATIDLGELGTGNYTVSFDATDNLALLIREKIEELIASNVLSEKPGYMIAYTINKGATVRLSVTPVAESSKYYENVTVTLSYEPIEYEALVKVDGIVIERVPYTVETSTLLPSVTLPAKVGYDAKWSAFTASIGGTEINAIYTPITYTATFVVDGEVVSTQSFTVETERLQSVAIPEKGGYHGRWPAYTLEAADLRIEAIYTATPAAILYSPVFWIAAVLAVAAIFLLLVVILRKKKKDDGGDDQGPAPAPTDDSDRDAAELPAVEEPIVEEPAVEAPVVEVPVVDELAAEEPIVEEPVVAEPVAEAPAPKPIKKIIVPEGERSSAVAQALSTLHQDTADDDMSTMLVMPDGRHVLIKYRKSFRARMIQSCDEAKSYYSEVKNYLLSFDGVAASDSWNYESFANGRKQIAKINVSGKTVVVFLALEPATLEGSKYKYDDVGARKRFEKTPVKIKVRSPRSLKWGKELIDMTMEANGRPFIALSEENYMDPYEEKEPLIARDLIQIMAKDVATGAKVDEEEIVNLIENGARIEHSAEGHASLTDNAESEEIIIPTLEDVTVEEAAVMVADDYAETHILHDHSVAHKGKLAIINIDTLNAAYESGGIVTLSSLIEKGLLPKSAGRLKVLARGHLTKALRVEADAYSLHAVKMILLTGGTPILLD